MYRLADMLYLFCLMILGVTGFQVALILGAPWGQLTLGGQVHEALPPIRQDHCRTLNRDPGSDCVGDPIC